MFANSMIALLGHPTYRSDCFSKTPITASAEQWDESSYAEEKAINVDIKVRDRLPPGLQSVEAQLKSSNAQGLKFSALSVTSPSFLKNRFKVASPSITDHFDGAFADPADIALFLQRFR
ncbi:MAG: hypothetical protein ACREQ2_29270 [Candidatus Binatia bacterium]